MKSMYADYTKEIHDREVFETDSGFVVYEFKDETCYIADIFIKKECRRSGIASDLARHVETLAKEKGAKTLLGSIIPTTNGATESMRAMLAYGFRIQSAHENFIWLKKAIT